MPVHPQAQMVLDQLKNSGMPSLHTLSPEAARAAYAMMRTRPENLEPVAKVEDRQIPGPAGSIPARFYYPEGSGPFPVLVYFHGGGWVIGSPDTHDAPCRKIANAAGCIVVSVDYRLAPEHKFPAAVEDAYAATCWVAEHAQEFNGDPERIAVGGDSAGGNLAAVVALMARDQGGLELRFQALIYPATDFAMNTRSHQENGSGYFLTREMMYWFRDHYLRTEEDKTNPLASPALAGDFRNLPPALVITAEYDPLRDEGEAYAELLRQAGVPVTCSCYDGMIHGFFSMIGVIDASEEAIRELADALRKAWR
ncbi:MAG: lipase [Bacillus thermozeamaize]|uniref:Lipase n=1 Tax=Bacillus thermozeamaize TaxID=230954 RepID=A0A1Y3PUN4_9BACI|nr:MAG: lipase [Bacillus thermozeamaize]